MVAKMNLFDKIKKKKKDAEMEKEKLRLKEIDATPEVQKYYKMRSDISKRFIDRIVSIREALETLEESDKCKVTDKVLDMYSAYFKEISDASKSLSREQGSYIYDKEAYSLEIIEIEYGLVRNARPNNTNFDITRFLNFTELTLVERIIR